MSFAAVDIQCPDCERTFHLITELEVGSCRGHKDRCPTCAFNESTKVFTIPEVTRLRYARRIHLYAIDDPRNPNYKGLKEAAA